MEVRNVAWNISQIARMVERGTIRFDYPVQRAGGQWSDIQKSYLIHTMIAGFPLPPVYFVSFKEEITTVMKSGEEKTKEENVRYVIDGKQRLTTLVDFLNNQYSLDAETPTVQVEGEEYELSGLYFDDLEEEVQDMFTSRTVLTYTLDGEVVSDDEIDDLFFRMNNGTALSRQQIAKAKMGVAWAEKLNKVTSSKFILNNCSFTKSQIKSDGHVLAIVQAMMMMDQEYEYKNVTAATISDYMSTFKEDSDSKEEILQSIEQAMLYLEKGLQDYGKENVLLKKVHLPMVLITTVEAMKMEIETDAFMEWYHDFRMAFKPKKKEVGQATQITEYEEFTGAGSTKKEKADGRLNEMKRCMTNYFKGEK